MVHNIEMEYPIDEPEKRRLVDLPIEAAEVSAFAESISSFNIAQDNVEAAVWALSRENTRQTAQIEHEKLHKVMTEVVQKFVDSVGLIITDDDMEPSSTVTGLLLSTEERRLDFFKSLDANDTTDYHATDYTELHQQVNDIFSQSQSHNETQAKLAMIYMAMLDKDGFLYIERRLQELAALEQEIVVATATEVPSRAERFLFKRRFGRRAMAGAVIAGGIGGALFAQLLNIRLR